MISIISLLGSTSHHSDSSRSYSCFFVECLSDIVSIPLGNICSFGCLKFLLSSHNLCCCLNMVFERFSWLVRCLNLYKTWRSLIISIIYSSSCWIQILLSNFSFFVMCFLDILLIILFNICRFSCLEWILSIYNISSFCSMFFKLFPWFRGFHGYAGGESPPASS